METKTAEEVLAEVIGYKLDFIHYAKQQSVALHLNIKQALKAMEAYKNQSES